MTDILDQLESIQRRTRINLVLQWVFLSGTGVISCFIILVLLDYIFRLPSTVRLFLLLVSLGFLAWHLTIRIIGMHRYHPSLVDVALRVEESIPSLRGRLASAAEFTMSGIDRTNPLAGRSINEASTRLSCEDISSALRPGPTRRNGFVFTSLAAVILLFILLVPSFMRIGSERILLPFSDTTWPARTGIRSLVSESNVHPRGTPLSLAAELTRGDPKDTRVRATFRYHDEDGAGDWNQIVLTRQTGSMFERLVDTDAESIEFSFSTNDATTAARMITLVTPPAIVSSTLTIDPPPYASNDIDTTRAGLGDGTDRRSMFDEGSLEGSTAGLELTMNKPMRVPSDTSSLRTTLGFDSEMPEDMTIIQRDPKTWSIQWTLREDAGLNLSLVDDSGITNLDQIGYTIRSAPDTPPTSLVLEPPMDITALPTATVEIIVEGRDDVSIRRMEILMDLESASSGEQPFHREIPGDGEIMNERITLSLEPMGLEPGDVLLLSAIVEDGYDLDGMFHEPVRSPVRRIRIISDVEFSEQVRQELSSIRRQAIRVESDQAQAADELRSTPDETGSSSIRSQSRITQRITTMSEEASRLQRATEINGLDDELLDEVLSQVEDLLQAAGEASTKATSALENPEDDTATALENQEEVIAEIEDLITLLDRDEDAWVATRNIENLLDQVRSIRSETEQITPEMIGRSMDELDTEQQEQLERLARRQSELSSETSSIMDDLRNRSRSIEEIDPSRARSMRSAATRAEQEDLSGTMDRASEQIQNNQLQRAGEQQQAAEDVLQQMIQDINDTRRARSMELQRSVQSLIQSIQRLVALQEQEIINLSTAKDRDPTTRPVSDGMITLYRNTVSVVQEARSSGTRTQRVARFLDRSSMSQDLSIVAARKQPVDWEVASTQQDRSLALLNDALEAANQLENQIQEEQADQERQEIIKTLVDLSQRETTLRDDTTTLLDSLTDRKPGRRELVESRRQAVTQDEIRIDIKQLVTENAGLIESPIFKSSVDLIDERTIRISTRLREGGVDSLLIADQAMVAISLLQMAEALRSEQPSDNPFAQDSQGSSSNGGGSGQQGQQQQDALVPPISELKLLRSMQEQVLQQTRMLDEIKESVDGELVNQEISRVGDLQEQLHALGEELLKKITQRVQQEESQ